MSNAIIIAVIKRDGNPHIFRRKPPQTRTAGILGGFRNQVMGMRSLTFAADIAYTMYNGDYIDTKGEDND